MKTDGDRLKLTKTMKISSIPIFIVILYRKNKSRAKNPKKKYTNNESRSNILRRAICCTNILLFGIFYGILSTLFIHKS